jgi:hypothetical protein
MRRWLGLFFLLLLAVDLPEGTFAEEAPIPAERLQRKPSSFRRESYTGKSTILPEKPPTSSLAAKSSASGAGSGWFMIQKRPT